MSIVRVSDPIERGEAVLASESGEGIVGRDEELREIDQIMAAARDGHGSGFLVLGPAGVGKSTLVGEATRRAVEDGWLALTATGTPAESALPYAGLHLLLQPLLSSVASLPEPQRLALRIAFGQASGPPPSPLLIGLACLTLITEAAAERPVLVLAEDAHWLDESTRTALWFVARRVTEDPVIVALTARTGEIDVAEHPNLSQVSVRPLDEDGSAQLVSRRSDLQTASARQRVLELAAGNPLALTELPAPVGDESAELPLSARLEDAFGSRIRTLTAAARSLLLITALSDGDTLAEITAATSTALNRPFEPLWVAEAIESGLVAVTGARITFRHPLMRSATLQRATPRERARGTGALIASLAGEPSRTVWLRASIAGEADESIAAELDVLAALRAGAGDPRGAALALHRAAELSSSRSSRARRVIDAAEFAERSGDYTLTADYLDELADEQVDARLEARMAWIRELMPTTGHVRVGGDITPALDAIEALRREGEIERALPALFFLATLVWGSSEDDHAAELVIAQAQRFGLHEADPRMLFIYALTAPWTRGLFVRSTIAALPPMPDDPQLSWLLGYALCTTGAVEEAEPFMASALDALRRAGQLQQLPHILLAWGWNCYLQGRLMEGRAAMEESAAISLDSGDPIGTAAGRAAAAFFHAIDGVDPDTSRMSADSDLAARALETSAIRTTITFAKGMAALTRGEDETALTELARLFDTADPAYHSIFAAIAIPDLVDAASRTGRHSEAAALISALQRGERTWQSPVYETAITYASVILAADDELDLQYAAAAPTMRARPFLTARLNLALGTRLRRLRRITDARAHLREALRVFRDVGAPVWAERALQELAASGAKTAAETPALLQSLTPQEIRVANLAAAGLTNRDIAERLFLSHRTVATHLYAAFRKLGITSREQIPDSLRHPDADPVETKQSHRSAGDDPYADATPPI